MYDDDIYIQAELNKKTIDEISYIDNLYIDNNEFVRMSKNKRIEKFKSDYANGLITTLDDKRRKKLCKKFDDTVIIGDSIAEQVKYMVFNDSYHVKAKRGVALPLMGDLINEAILQYPKNIIFLKGLNDAGYYTDSNVYAQYYEMVIEDIKKKLPDVNIYICSILPPSEKLLKDAPYLKTWETHNIVCKNMCERIGVNYVDTIFLLRENDHMRNADGMHFTIRYYDMWLQYMDIMVNY